MGRKRSPQRVKVNQTFVREWLDRRHMTQNEMAALMGITGDYLSRIVNGTRGTSPKVRRLLQKTLGCSEFEELFIVVNADE